VVPLLCRCLLGLPSVALPLVSVVWVLRMLSAWWLRSVLLVSQGFLSVWSVLLVLLVVWRLVTSVVLLHKENKHGHPL
jgi:hypothetical protein